jgi:hypothetical protein
MVPRKGLRAYWTDNNLKSLDGLPGVLTAHKSREVPLSIDWKGECAGSGQSKGKKNGEIVVDRTRYIRLGVVESAIAQWFEGIKFVVAFSMGVLAASAYVKLSKK